MKSVPVVHTTTNVVLQDLAYSLLNGLLLANIPLDLMLIAFYFPPNIAFKKYLHHFAYRLRTGMQCA
jgi:hypothetical protein